MRALILAAGYATRMYPLTLDRPKSLLPIGRRVVLDWMMDTLQTLPDVINDIAIVTNAKFAAPFEQWTAQRRWTTPVHVINDGSTTDENRLGAIRDIQLALEQTDMTAPLLVTAGDHIVEWDVRSFCAFGQSHAPHASVALYRLPDIREASRFGIVEIDATQRIIRCEEKPQHPRSDLAMICFYYLPPPVFPRLAQYLHTGRNTDAPGNFIVWLNQQEPVYGWPADGKYFDIGSLESYHATCAAFSTSAPMTRQTSGDHE